MLEDRVSRVDGPDDIRIGVMGGPGIHTVYLRGFAHETIPHAPVSKVLTEKPRG